MGKISIVIADDDYPSRVILKEFISLLSDYHVVGEASNGDELVECLIKNKPDIALVDINMPGLNGLDTIKSCKDVLPNLQIIFTTGYTQFAVEAFNLSAADYLVKPIERIRLNEALQKAKYNIGVLSPNKNRMSEQKLYLKSNSMIIYLNINDILFVEKEARKSVVHTVDNSYETTYLLQEYESRLPEYFFKTHRSYLVNLKKISFIEPSGETYLAYFSKRNKVAHISKLKIHEVEMLITK